MEENKDASELFRRFEPKIYGKEEYHIFNAFTPYKEEEVEMLLARVKKAHSREKLDNEDYQLLKVPDRLPKTTINTPKENLFMLTNPQEYDRKGQERSSLRHKLSSHTLTQNKSSSILLADKTNTVKLPRCPSGSITTGFSAIAPGNTSGTGYLAPRKLRFNNIIIIVPPALPRKAAPSPSARSSTCGTTSTSCPRGRR